MTKNALRSEIGEHTSVPVPPSFSWLSLVGLSNRRGMKRGYRDNDPRIPGAMRLLSALVVVLGSGCVAGLATFSTGMEWVRRTWEGHRDEYIPIAASAAAIAVLLLSLTLGYGILARRAWARSGAAAWLTVVIVLNTLTWLDASERNIGVRFLLISLSAGVAMAAAVGLRHAMASAPDQRRSRNDMREH